MLTYGVISSLGVGLVFGSILLVADWLLRPAPAIPTPELPVPGPLPSGPPQRCRRRTVPGLWLNDAISTLGGLSAIGIASPVGIELIGISPVMAAASVSLFAVLNGVSRPLFGWLCDRWTPAQAAMLVSSLILVGNLLMLRAGQGDMALYLVAFCLFWSALGGWLAIAPATTLHCFPAGLAVLGIVLSAKLLPGPARSARPARRG